MPLPNDTLLPDRSTIERRVRDRLLEETLELIIRARTLQDARALARVALARHFILQEPDASTLAAAINAILGTVAAGPGADER